MATALADLIRHTDEFTAHELLTLRVWFDLDIAGNDELAERFLKAGLSLEHFTSLLPSNLAERTPEQMAQQSFYAFELQRILNEANEFLRARAHRLQQQASVRELRGAELVTEYLPGENA